MPATLAALKLTRMFTVDEPTAEAIRRAFDNGGELSGVVEFKRHLRPHNRRMHADYRCMEVAPRNS